jgi:hypothetical protein
MHGPTCIFWANLIPFSLHTQQGGGGGAAKLKSANSTMMTWVLAPNASPKLSFAVAFGERGDEQATLARAMSWVRPGVGSGSNIQHTTVGMAAAVVDRQRRFDAVFVDGDRPSEGRY